VKISNSNYFEDENYNNHTFTVKILYLIVTTLSYGQILILAISVLNKAGEQS